jgi:uncharacterized membrane protein (DUF2068 family)
LQTLFQKELPLLKPVADQLGIDLQSAGPVRLIREALGLSPHTLAWLTAGVAAYGLLELLEAVGLWLRRRWGEYVASVGTSVFLPYEIYELTERITVLRILAFLVNLGAVVYLVYTKRLFGVRGGREAFERERQAESLLEVEQVAAESDGTESDGTESDGTESDGTESDGTNG